MYKTKENQKVIAYILKDANNQPFVKILYDFGKGLRDAFSLNTEESKIASDIFRKSFGIEKNGIVKYNPETGIKYSVPDTNRMYTPSYITGSEIGKENSLETITFLSNATGNSDIMIPFYVSNGKDIIFANENLLARNEGIIINEDEWKKRETLNNQLLEQMLTDSTCN